MVPPDVITVRVPSSAVSPFESSCSCDVVTVVVPSGKLVVVTPDGVVTEVLPSGEVVVTRPSGPVTTFVPSVNTTVEDSTVVTPSGVVT